MKLFERKSARVIAATLSVVLLIGVGLTFSQVPAAAATGGKNATATQTTISWSQAKAVFLEEYPQLTCVKYLRLTTEDGRQVYKGKAARKSYVYSIEIDGVSGEVIEKDRDYEGSVCTATKAGAVKKSVIKNKIRDKVPGATIIYVKLTTDDGRYVYEAEAYRNGIEYDFEYSRSGRLLEFEKEAV